MEFPQTYDSLTHWARTVAVGDCISISLCAIGGTISGKSVNELPYRIKSSAVTHFGLKIHGIVTHILECTSTPTETKCKLTLKPIKPGRTEYLLSFTTDCIGEAKKWGWTLQGCIPAADGNLRHRMGCFLNEGLTVLPLRPFMDEVVERADARAYRAERVAFSDVLMRHGAVPQGMAADLALLMFP